MAAAHSSEWAAAMQQQAAAASRRSEPARMSLLSSPIQRCVMEDRRSGDSAPSRLDAAATTCGRGLAHGAIKQRCHA